MTTPIEQLPYRTQIARFRALALAALADYDLPPARLTLIHHRGNTTFRVDTATGPRYVLRIHRFGSPTVERVGAELAWLAAIRRDTPLEVPDPLPTRAGALYTLAATPAIPTPHICDLLRWLPGQRRLRGLTPAHMERVGALTAHLHDHAVRFNPPLDFGRGRVDTLDIATRLHIDPYTREVVAAVRTLVTETLSPAEADMVVAVIAYVRAAAEMIGHDLTNFGLIHADLHQYNLLFDRTTVRPIDFDDCGFGPRLYDPAVTLYMFQGRPSYPALRAAYLAGYRRVRPLSAAHEAAIDPLIALRSLQDALWALRARRAYRPDADWLTEARMVLAPLPAFLANNGQFPTGP